MEEIKETMNENKLDESNEGTTSQYDDVIRVIMRDIGIGYPQTSAIRELCIAHNAFAACPKLKKIIIKK